MFCPNQRIKNSVIWHYSFNQDGSRMPYPSAEPSGKARLLVHEVDTACLESSRNFLRWASSVELHMGESEVVYRIDRDIRSLRLKDCDKWGVRAAGKYPHLWFNKYETLRHPDSLHSIEHLTCRQERSRLVRENGVLYPSQCGISYFPTDSNMQSGTKDSRYGEIDWAGSNFVSAGFAFEKFPVVAENFITGEASFTKGTRDIPMRVSRDVPYDLEIHHARSIKVVLYDVKDRRG